LGVPYAGSALRAPCWRRRHFRSGCPIPLALWAPGLPPCCPTDGLPVGGSASSYQPAGLARSLLVILRGLRPADSAPCAPCRTPGRMSCLALPCRRVSCDVGHIVDHLRPARNPECHQSSHEFLWRLISDCRSVPWGGLVDEGSACVRPRVCLRVRVGARVCACVAAGRKP